MTQHTDESTKREFLLGRLEEMSPARRRIEERLAREPDFCVEMDAAEDDLIDDYVRDALPSRDREDFERFFLVEGERRDKLAFAFTFNKRLPEPAALSGAGHRPAPKRFAWLRWPEVPSYVTAAALALIILAVGLVVWRVFFRRSEVGEGLAALQTAYSRGRPVESRVTGLGYARLAETRGREGEYVDATSLDLARVLLSRAPRDEPDTQHALGRLYLYERRFDEAVPLLEAAAAADPDDARLQNDLGAALLERGKDAHGRGDEAKAALDYARSLGHLDRALALDGSLADALFNRAILHENMHSETKAEEDWRSYLEKDKSSPWAEEAKARLGRLEEKRRRGLLERDKRFEEFEAAYRAGDVERAWEPLGRSRGRAGNKIVERLIDARLGRGADGRGAEAAEALEMLAFAGAVEERKSGDRFTADLARFYRGASPTQLEAVARARSHMGEAYRRFYQGELDEALKLYTEARREFEQGGDRCEALLAEQWQGFCYIRIPVEGEGVATFKRLAETSEASGYEALHAQTLQALADVRGTDWEWSQAREYADRAMKLSVHIGYDENVVRCWQSYAVSDRQARNYTQSLAASLRGLGLARESSTDPKVLWTFYAVAGLNYLELGLYGAALAFEQEALRLALESEWPFIIQRSYAHLAQVYTRTQKQDLGEALRVAGLAVEQAKGIRSERSRNNVLANALLRLGHVHREAGDYARALESYDQAIGLYEGLKLGVYDLEAHTGKLKAYEAMGDAAAAEGEIKTLLARLEEHRRTMREVQTRDGFFDAAQGVYDAAVDFAHTRRGDPRAAFNYAEMSHGRSMLDLMRSGAQEVSGAAGRDIRPQLATEPLTLDEVSRRMPERVQILQYHVLEDKLLMWLVSRDEFEPHAVSVKADALAGKVKAYRELLKSEDERSLDAAAKELYELLVGPLGHLLDPDKQLCIVADKSLHGLPFASLVSPASGRYLAEERTLLRAPGASVFVEASEAAGRKMDGAGETLLSVGNPDFDREKFRGLPPLPSAAREARDVAALYGARPLLGERAGEEEVTRGMLEADVIQLASHYVVDPGSPLHSRLLLARDRRQAAAGEASDGELQVFEVYRMSLPRARLVVLSACQTEGERVYGGEGAVGIARPFITAGAALVVASLWPVESGPTADLMVSFHRHRTRDRLHTAEAFRRAQLDMLSSPDPRNRRPANWAAFTLIGGYAEF